VTDQLAEPAGVGQVRLVRTFRVAADGGLYAVHSPARWLDGWNVARCRKGRAHTPPAEGCGCGFYAYAHPAYTRRQPTSGQVLAVVAARGTMEAGTRGARAGQARIEAVWLGPRVDERLASRVRDRYPTVLVYRDRAALFADFPLTHLEGFRRPRLGERWRWAGYGGLGALLAAAGLVGGLGGSTATQEGGPVWIAVVLVSLAVAVVAVFRKAQMVTLAAMTAVAWMITETSTSVAAAVYRALIVLVDGWVVGSWWWTGRVGADPAESSISVFVRRLRGLLPGG
jgi:hypothetical protein